MKARIKSDMMVAWKAKEIKKKDFLKFIIGEIERKEDANTKLTDAEIVKLIGGIVKNLSTLSTMTSLSEAAMASVYLPVELGQGAIEASVAVIIAKESYSGMKDMGKVMSAFNTEFPGQADGRVLSEIVKAQLI
jgi:uncharacterized protein YqeY